MIKLYLYSYALSIVTTLFGALLKIMDWQGATRILIIAGLLSLIYIVIALKRILTNKEKSQLVKIMWFVGFVFFPWLCGLIYYIVELKPRTIK